jgi:outer membrane protein, adhesin transport system
MRVAVHLKIFLILLLLVCNKLSAQVLDPLEQLINQALLSYPSILSRQFNRDAAETDVTAAKLKFLPNPTFGTQRNQVRFDGGQSSGQMPSTNITVSQPLLVDGGIIAGYLKSGARLSAADFGLLEIREDISRRTITAYAEWHRAHLKIQALGESVKIHENLASLINRRYGQGVASGSDKDLAYSRLSQAQADLDAQRSQSETALTTLAELVGNPITNEQLAKKKAREIKLPKRSEAITLAQINSVTVQRNKFEAEAVEQEANEIRAQALPQFSIQAQRQIGNAVYPGAQGFNSVGIVANYALGGGLSNIANASAARDRARAASLQVETSKRDLNDRLNAEYSEYEFSLLRKESLRRSVDLSGDISASYDRQYMVGRKSWLDLMNAVRERAQTKVQLADAEAGLIGSSRRLMVYIEGTQQFEGARK